jgi:hypothetical protein
MKFNTLINESKYPIGYTWNSMHGTKKILSYRNDEVTISDIDSRYIIQISELEDEIKDDLKRYQNLSSPENLAYLKRKKEDEEREANLKKAEEEENKRLNKILVGVSEMKKGQIKKQLIKLVRSSVGLMNYKDLIEKILDSNGKISEQGILVPPQNLNRDIAVGVAQLNTYLTIYAMKYGEFKKLDYKWISKD